MTVPYEEGAPHGIDALRAAGTLGEILELAIRFELTARDFYAALAPRVGKPVRYLVEELAAEEAVHADLFRRLAQRPDLAEAIRRPVGAALVPAWSDGLQRPDLGERPDDQTVLQYALGRERAAMVQYRGLAEAVEAGPVRDLFHFLAEEEAAHTAALERLWYDLVQGAGAHPGSAPWPPADPDAAA